MNLCFIFYSSYKILIIIDNLVCKIVKLFIFLFNTLETIFIFFKLHLIQPLKFSFKFFSSVPDFFMILILFSILLLILSLILEVYEEKIINYKYFNKACILFKNFKSEVFKIFLFFKFNAVKFFKLGENIVVKKIIKFVFIVTVILCFLDLVKIDSTLFTIFFLLGLLMLIINS